MINIVGLGLCDSDGDLSSDDEDHLLYTRSFDDDLNRSGAAYAKYKQKMLKDFYEDDHDDDEEEEEEDD